MPNNLNIKKKFNTFVRSLKMCIYAVVIALVVLELLFITLLAFPSLAKSGLLKITRILYTETSRNILQWDPDCAVYDPFLCYKLKTGEFIFSNNEFKNTFKVNSLGVRDDEDSLKAPDIIVAGDSYAMGWGVEQDETYSQLLEKSSGLKVLNIGVASYGTAREMIMLNRTDRSNLKYLIVHYCENDYYENKTAEKYKKLPIMNPDLHREKQRGWQIRRKYYFGKYISYLLREIIPNIKEKYRRYVSNEIEADEAIEREKNEIKYFIYALLNFTDTDYSKVQLIVLGESGFIQSLSKGITENKYPEIIENMITVDLDNLVDEDMKYPIDRHYTARGHAAIAEALLNIIKQ